MDKQFNHHDHGGGFMHGFLFGAIIGAAFVFFVFTEKGKKILETISEEGFEGLSDLKDLVKDEMNEEDEDSEYEEEQYERENLQPVPHRATHSHVEPIHNHEEHTHMDHEDEEIHEHPSKVKRFFRGIKR